jgi:antitoxin component of MazEF toxin-antitoxin module
MRKGNKPEEPERQTTYQLHEPRPSLRVEEARAVWLVPEADEADHGVTRLSAKNQITLPVAMVRQIGLQAGDEIDLTLHGNTILLERRPRTPEEWIQRYRGSMQLEGWETPERADAYVRGERESWTRDGGDF